MMRNFGATEKLLRISLLCALHIYLMTFDVRRRPGNTIWRFSVRYLFNMIYYPPAKIIVKCFHRS